MTAMTPDEHDLFAAEYVLGLLDADAIATAEARLARDPVFAAAVAGWQDRTAPWLDAVPSQAPDPAMWDRINAALPPAASNDNIASLERQVGRWRMLATGAGAMAAALALVVGLRVINPPTPPAAVTPAPALMATLTLPDGGGLFNVMIDPQNNRFVATPANVTGDGVHVHQLWVMDAAGEPRALGLTNPAAPHRAAIMPAAIDTLSPGATIAMSVEPLGGSPTARPSGPVIASAQLSEI
jgi:anti-sigma-K factor RskA